MKIIYEDKKIMVVCKKAGQLTQSGKSFDLDLTSEVLAYRKKKGEEVYAALINRLDRPVSGLVLFAKNKQEAARLSKQMQQGSFNKQYYAWVCGKLTQSQGTLVDYLKKDEKNNTSAVVADNVEGAKRAELRYEVVREVECHNDTINNVLTLVKIQLITGRHHQIRVQFSSRGCPLLGDGKYGSDLIAHTVSRQEPHNDYGIKLGRQEIALCAYSLEVDGKVYEVKPEWM